jgi:hypothetical protein
VRGRDPLPPVSPQRARDDDDFNAERVRPRRGPPRLNSPMPTKIFDEPRATPPSRWAGFPSLDGSFAGWASVPPRVRDALLEIGARSRRAYVRMDGEEFDILSLTSSGQPASRSGLALVSDPLFVTMLLLAVNSSMYCLVYSTYEPFDCTGECFIYWRKENVG